MIPLTVIGVISDGCPQCHTAIENLRSRFRRFDIELAFVLIRKSDDPEAFAEVTAKYNLNKPPSFSIFGDVYSGLFFPTGKVMNTVHKVRAWANTQP